MAFNTMMRADATATRRIALIAAPSNLGLMPQPGEREPGARKAPDVLQSLGISERLGAESSRTVSAPPYSPEVDATTGVRNAPALRRYSETLADAVGEELNAGRFPLVIGGDCSVLLGPALALRRRGRHGLIFFDGHTDFKLPATSPSKGAAGMDLAFVTGHGPAPLVDFGEHTPLFQEADTIAFGYRDLRDPATYTSKALFETQVQRMDLTEVRRRGVSHAARAALDAVGGDAVEGVFIHFDVDVLDSEIMSAVDTPEPGGFLPAEAVEALRTWCADPRVIGIEVTIYDPDRDPDRRCGKLLVDILSAALCGHRQHLNERFVT
ncbi:arginase family protein [Mesorhizobium sp. B2-7-2]|uniref:arginase family protein n=1 Tax=Mesorhizobium sp. B2-7-2 TaxID=2589908 RepID=UPI0015E46783|nr:arginase family protein [Mesorhizobium sp. B2-7-2]